MDVGGVGSVAARGVEGDDVGVDDVGGVGVGDVGVDGSAFVDEFETAFLFLPKMLNNDFGDGGSGNLTDLTVFLPAVAETAELLVVEVVE